MARKGKATEGTGVEAIPRRQMNLRIEEASVENLKRLAAGSGESLNAAATRILEEAIGKPAPEAVPETAEAMALYLLPETLRRIPFREKACRIACWSLKGGTGKTSVAVGLGHYLSWGTEGRTGRVLLVDLDEFGDAFMQSEDLRQKYSITDPAGVPTFTELQASLPHDAPAGSVSWEDVRGHLAVDANSGLYLLLPPAFGDSDSLLNAGAYGAALEAIEHLFDFIVFDCGPHFLSSLNGLTPLALSSSQAIVLVGDQTFPTIIHTVRYFAKIVKKSKILPNVKDRYAYVVNRYDESVPSSLEEVGQVMTKFVSAVLPIPAANREGLQTSNDGINLIFASRKDVKLAFRDLASWVLTATRGLPEGRERPDEGDAPAIAAIKE